MAAQAGFLATAARAMFGGFWGGGGYDAGRHDRPETEGWHRQRMHAESAFTGSDPTLVARTEAEDRNNPWINGALDRDWESVVGSGLQPWPTPIYRLLGRDVEWANEWARGYRDLYRQWAEDPLHRADANMRESYGRLEAKARLNFRRGGEILVEIRRDERGAPCPVNILLIDPARLANPTGKAESDPNYRNGIEYAGGVAVAAWLRPHHPESTVSNKGMNEPVRVPFRTTTGLPNLLLISHTRFIEQVRGVSPLAASLIASKMLDSFEDDIANRAKLEAQMGVFITAPGSAEDLADAIAPGSGSRSGNALEAYTEFRDKNPIKAIKSLFLRVLRPDEKPSFMPAVTASADMSEFRKTQHAKMAASQGVSLPEISQNFEGINLSNMRAITNMRWRIVELERTFWSQQFSQPINLAVMEHYVAIGALKIPGGPANFYRKLAAVTNTTWIGPDRGVTDIEKEARGNSLNEAAYRQSPYEAIIAKGRDPDEILDQFAAFYAAIERRNLPKPDYNTKGGQSGNDEADSGGAGDPADRDGDGVPNEAAKRKTGKPSGGTEQ